MVLTWLDIYATLVATFLANPLVISPSVSPVRESTVKTGCPILAADAKPIVQVTSRRSRAPLALYPLGFSKQGRFAWLEQRQGFDSQDFVWILQVVDLNNDRVLARRDFSVKHASVEAMCTQYGAAFARILVRLKIERGSALALEQPNAALGDPLGVDFLAGPRDSRAHKTPYRVFLRGKDGGKQLGILWRIEVDSGQDPVGVPKLAGILRSPFEPRVAVVITQQMIGTEGAEIKVVTMLGARLDKGWHPQPTDPKRP